jgi:hypothetical protein
MNHDINKRNFNVRPQQDFGAMPRGLVVALKRQGFEVVETGGGCTAWRKSLPSGHVLITDDASHILDRGEADIGIYDDEENSILCVSGKFGESEWMPLVRDEVQDMPFSAALPDDIMDLPATSAVGEMVIRLCNASTAGAAQFNEHDLQEAYTAAVVRQCEIWLHG